MGKLLTHAGGMLGMRLYIYVYLTVKHTGILLKNIIMHFPNIRFRNNKN